VVLKGAWCRESLFPGWIDPGTQEIRPKILSVAGTGNRRLPAGFNLQETNQATIVSWPRGESVKLCNLT